MVPLIGTRHSWSGLVYVSVVLVWPWLGDSSVLDRGLHTYLIFMCLG